MVIGMIFNMAFTAVFISSNLIYICRSITARAADNMAVSKYNRHIWDVPICWMDARFMKVCKSSKEDLMSTGE